MFKANGETVVIVVADRIDPRDRAETRNRTTGLHAERAAGEVWIGLVVIAENRQAQAMVAVVCDFEDGVHRKLALHGDEPILDVGPLGVRWNVNHIRVDWIEA